MRKNWRKLGKWCKSPNSLAPSAGELDFFQRVMQPFHDDIGVLSCLVNKTVSLCKTQYLVDTRNIMFKSCKGKGRLSDIFSSLLEATMTGQYIMEYAAINSCAQQERRKRKLSWEYSVRNIFCQISNLAKRRVYCPIMRRFGGFLAVVSIM